MVQLCKFPTKIKQIGFLHFNKEGNILNINKSQPAFEIKYLEGCSEPTVYKKYCSVFLAMCAEQKTAILGIEGVQVNSDGSRKLLIEEIADFSCIEAETVNHYLELNQDAAKNFISCMQKEGKGDAYCFTVITEDEIVNVINKKN